MSDHNEIKQCMDSRYVSAPENAWRLFGFKMHDQSHSIIRLQIHLPSEQNVVFHPDNVRRAAQKASEKHTTLTAWFDLNQSDVRARNYFYHEIPDYYVFSNNFWNPRKRMEGKIIGRMYSVSIADSERYFLRVLLLHVKGATSYQDLLIFNGVYHETFKDAAKARGLLADDGQWEATLEDAKLIQMPFQMRQLFALLCVFATPSDIVGLYNKFYASLLEDFTHKHACLGNCIQCEDCALRDIQETLVVHGKKLSQFGLRTPSVLFDSVTVPQYNIDEEASAAQSKIETFNEHQKLAFETIVSAVGGTRQHGNCFCLDGPAGSGKTYLYSTLLSYFRGQGSVVLPVASTGIAANLLASGRTYFSQYKLPVPLLENSTSSIRLNSIDAKLIKAAVLLIWDEVTMATCHALNAVDRLLKDIMEDDSLPFGNKVILLGGDFRQCLPVVPYASRQSIVQSSIKFSALWKYFKTLPLKINVRSVDQDYSQWLLKLGNGELTTTKEDFIELPNHVICEGSIVEEIFGKTMDKNVSESSSQKAILCPKNDCVDSVNSEVLALLTGETQTYYSCDSIEDGTAEDSVTYTLEFLNSLTPSGMPPHSLNLKEGSIVMLLRNLNTKRGLCNGTRLIVTELKTNLILAKVLTGSATGRILFIPRIDLAPVNPDLPFVLKRRQFPVKLAFGMSINKSQGQTLQKVGIYLKDPAFTHGQLYVAFSRVAKWDDVRVRVNFTNNQASTKSDKVFTKNIVFKEVL